jgi:hypothetical protein
MPYVKGETPMVGDRVQNRFGKVGKVVNDHPNPLFFERGQFGWRPSRFE